MQYDPDRALHAAMQLFWSKGYEATSMQDLLTAMGLSKSSLYQGFGGKKELFMRCLERYRSHMHDAFRQLLETSDSGLKFIETVLFNSAAEARHPDQLRRGCLLMNTATEFAQKDRQVAEHVTTGFKGLRKALKVAVQRGQQDGSITTKQDAGILADYLSCSLGGIKTVVKGGADEKTVKEIVGVILKALT